MQVNSCDSDKGILTGRWDGKYDGGCSPMDWYGSVRIINQYMETGKPVKYGQCWVFSGVTTTGLLTIFFFFNLNNICLNYRKCIIYYVIISCVHSIVQWSNLRKPFSHA